MKVQVEGNAFRDAMKTASIMFEAEAEVLLTADPDSGSLYIETGKNGVYLKQKIEASVPEAGQIVVACAHFSQLSFADILILESDGKEVVFKSGKFKGTVAASSDSEAIEAARPEKAVKIKTKLPTEILRSAVSRVAFGMALPGSQSGIRIQAKEELTLSVTDGYRATIYKEKLALAQTEFDVLLQPAFLHTILSRVQDLEVGMAVHQGTFRLKTDVIDMFHPSIQSTPEDIEAWLESGIDYDKRECVIQTTAEEMTKAVREVSSIHMGSVAYDTYVDCLIKGGKAHLRCVADHGSAQTSLQLKGVTVDKYVTKLSSRYVLEMLNLIKVGDIEMSFWDSYILFSGVNGKFRSLIPTVAA